MQLEKEIANLLATAPKDKQDLAKSQFNVFVHLFQRFLKESGPSVNWNQIEKLPTDAVSTQQCNNLKCFHVILITYS